MKISKTTRKPRGFSLVETSIAMTLLGIIVPAILAVFYAASEQAGKSLKRDSLVPLRGYIHQRLGDPTWPKEAPGSNTWSHEIAFARDGSPLPGGGADESPSAIKASMSAVPAPHLREIGLEQIRVEFRRGKSDELLGIANFQRHRPL